MVRKWQVSEFSTLVKLQIDSQVFAGDINKSDHCGAQKHRALGVHFGSGQSISGGLQFEGLLMCRNGSPRTLRTSPVAPALAD